MSDDLFEYALFTLQAGHRPISAFAEIFEKIASSIVPRLEEIEEESGTTRRRGLEIALSDMAILTIYSLAEGFFFEEYEFYFKKQPRQSLEKVIAELLIKLNITDEKIDRYVGKLASIRGARNAIAHRNGRLKDDEKKEIGRLFGVEVCTSHRFPVASAKAIIQLIQDVEALVSTYSELALQSVSQAKQAVQPDGNAAG